MGIATLNLKVAPRRMLSEREAAEYCGLQSKHFKIDCPVVAIALPRGKRAYDLRDLDDWIDGLKGNTPNTDDDILSRL